MSDLRVTVYEGLWGDWGKEVVVPAGCYINRIRVRYEAPIGSGDDTALNGIEIQYVSLSGVTPRIEKTAVVHPGHWGEWRDWVNVPDGYYIIGFNTRFEPHRSDQDDTGLNGLEMICKAFWADDFKRIMIEPGNWGRWTGEKLAPYPNWGVVGLQARVERPKRDNDDTAMNGIHMFCRKLT